MGAIAGADFFTVEVLTPFGLVRYLAFFLIDIRSRRVHIAGITNQPRGSWMKQIARNLTDRDRSNTSRGSATFDELDSPDAPRESRGHHLDSSIVREPEP